MKYILSLSLLLLAEFGQAQTRIPDFLQGTWRIGLEEKYEHWDKLHTGALKGISYQTEDGRMVVSEYLEIELQGNELIYTATVIGQNAGKGIRFTCTHSDSTFIFENPDHDFPKKIIYEKQSDTGVFVLVSDGKEKSFAYMMYKQFKKTFSQDSTIANPNYDPLLAQKLGADEYGMKGYVLVMLKTGSNQTTDKELINKCFRGHMENIDLLVKEGKMTVAGPLGKNEQHYRGIFILNVTSFEEATSLLQNDLAIKEGLLAFDLYKWYGSAALPEYLDYADKIWKTSP